MKGHSPRDESEEILRGGHAQQLLEDPLLEEVFSFIQERCFRAWLATAVGGHEIREKLYLEALAVELMRKRLTGIADTGRLAATARATRVEGLRQNGGTGAG